MIDWNGNGKIDPIDIGITAGMIEPEEDYDIENDGETGIPNASVKRNTASAGFLDKLKRLFK